MLRRPLMRLSISSGRGRQAAGRRAASGSRTAARGKSPYRSLSRATLLLALCFRFYTHSGGSTTMQTLIGIGVVILGYLLGSIPFGLLIVKLKTGKDVRTVESGRTGGTNVVRAAGLGAGLLTALLDVLKGAVSVWIAEAILPQNPLIHILAPLAAILGHNYSLFLIRRDENGKLRSH